IFFKAGILARLEDIRDEKLSAIMTGFQTRIRSYLAQTDVKRRHEQRAGLLIVQRNVRSWMQLRTWEWFKLYGKVKPMLRAGKEQEEMDALTVKIKELEDNLTKEEGTRKELESQLAKLVVEKNELFQRLQNEESGKSDYEARLTKLQAQKSDMDKQLNELNERLADQEDRNADLSRAKKKAEQEIDNLKKNVSDMELSLRKAETEKQNREHNIRSLQDEMGAQDETVAKLNKEKKHQEEVRSKFVDGEERGNGFSDPAAMTYLITQ
uniref:Myosin heavy chain n=1 Tax=Plectus sambesii TaxID=2011161 RepID=A0A914ULX1_9BILA